MFRRHERGSSTLFPILEQYHDEEEIIALPKKKVTFNDT